MSPESPQVSIGLPVYNGMPFLSASLDSLRCQTHERLEILICDNASDDATEDYCRAVSEADPRVKYYRFDSNAGAAANFRRSLELSSAEYFAWAAHDDSYHPQFVATCLAVLRQYPRAAMCTPSHRLVSQEGKAIGIVKEPPSLASDDLATRLHAHLWRAGWYTVYGVGRRLMLLDAPAPMPVYGWDVVYIWLLLMSHPIVVTDDVHINHLVQKPRSADTMLAEITGLPSHARKPYTSLRRSLRNSLIELGLDPVSEAIAVRTLAQWLWSSHFRQLIGLDLAVQARRMRARDARLREAMLWLVMASVSPGAGASMLRERFRGGLNRPTV